MSIFSESSFKAIKLFALFFIFGLFPLVTTMIFMILKIAVLVNWPWGFVLSPCLIYTVIWLIILGGCWAFSKINRKTDYV